MRLTTVLLMSMLSILLAACQTKGGIRAEHPPVYAEHADILELALTRALVDRELPDVGLLQDRHRVVLSDSHIEREWLPVLPGIELILMSEEQIAAKANRDGDFLFVYVSDFDLGVENTARVRVQSVWARSDDSTVIYQSGGGFTVTYERDGDNWVEASSVSWIS